MAVALTEEEGSLLQTLDGIRYRDGRVSFLDRLHFFVVDWIPENRAYVEDVTRSIGGRAARKIERKIGRKHFLDLFDLESSERRWRDRKHRTWILPSSALADVTTDLEHGMIVVLIGREDWLFARHTALLTLDGERPALLHASGAARQVVEEDFASVLRESHQFVGFKLLRIRSRR